MKNPGSVSEHRTTRLKALFGFGYFLYAIAATLISVGVIVTDGPPLVWSGVFVSCLPFVYLFARVMIAPNVARTSAGLPILSLVSLAGLAVSLYAFTSDRSVGLIAPVMAFAGAAGFVLFAVWFSRFGRGINELLASSVAKSLKS